MTDHNADGTFAPGNNANPTGKNGHLEGWQRYGDRLRKWLALPGDEIAELVSNGEKRNKLSSIDIACVRQAAAIIGGEQWLEALERGLDAVMSLNAAIRSTEPNCKCIVSTSTSQPVPVCPLFPNKP